MNLNDVRKWRESHAEYFRVMDGHAVHIDWLIVEAEKLERVREWRKRLSNHEAVGTIEFDKALSDDKPKYTVLEQAVSACTCEYRPSRKCPIHGKVERSEHTVYKKGFCTCGLPLDDHGRCPEADLNLPESPQNIDEPDWGGLGKISNTHFLTAKLVEAVRWLKARIEALEK